MLICANVCSDAVKRLVALTWRDWAHTSAGDSLIAIIAMMIAMVSFMINVRQPPLIF